MSNCIRIVSGATLKFRKDEFDVDALKKDIEEFGDKDPYLNPKDVNHLKNYHLYWFVNKRNTSFEDDAVTIVLQEARSSHTQRDFTSTLIFLSNNYLKKGKTFKFRVQDEVDNFSSTETNEVVMVPGQGVKH